MRPGRASEIIWLKLCVSVRGCVGKGIVRPKDWSIGGLM